MKVVIVGRLQSADCRGRSGMRRQAQRSEEKLDEMRCGSRARSHSRPPLTSWSLPSLSKKPTGTPTPSIWTIMVHVKPPHTGKQEKPAWIQPHVVEEVILSAVDPNQILHRIPRRQIQALDVICHVAELFFGWDRVELLVIRGLKD